MNKIPTLFQRDETNRAHVTREPNPACEWVLAGEGVALRKYDGTCVMLDEDGWWWARREVKPGAKHEPPDFQEISTDPINGKRMGWEPIDQSPFAKFHGEALDARLVPQGRYHVGTYELIGPKINGNPERSPLHQLIRHADAETVPDAPRDFDGLSAWMFRWPQFEGIVWHYAQADGTVLMAKLKRRDFPATSVGSGVA